MELNLQNEFVIFRNEEPYKFVKEIKTVERSIIGEGYLEEFRWSTDNGTFSSWVILSGSALRDLPLTEDEPDLYIQNRVTNLDNNPISIDGYSYTFEHWTASELDIKYPPVICDTRGILKNAIEITSAIFKPYEINYSLCMYNELNYTVNNLFGWDVEYFRVEPDLKTIDPILMEYSLGTSFDKQCVKVLVPDNEFPDAKPDYIPMGIEFEMPFEVHIDKSYWQELYPGTMPQADDVMYFPKSRRIYDVLNSYAVKAFMEEESYYAIALVKHTPKSNIIKSLEIEDYMDQLATSVEKEFGETTDNMVEDIANPQQFERFQGSKYDITRQYINESLVVVEEKVNSGNVILMERHYDMSNLLTETVISYYAKANLTVDEDFGYSSWFNIINKRTIVNIDNVSNFALIDNTITFKFNRIRQYTVGDWIEFKRGEIKFIITVDSVSESGGETTIIGEIDTNILDNLNQRFPNWSMLGNYQISPADKNTLLLGWNTVTNTGIDIAILLNRYISIKINDKNYFFSITNDILFNTWYGIVINASNKFKQIDVEIWGIKPNEHENGLLNLFTQTIPIDSIIYNTDVEYSLIGSPIKLTNIRIWNKTMQIEKQENILSQLIVNDAHLAIVIDNALPINTLPYIARIDDIDIKSSDIKDDTSNATIDVNPDESKDYGVWIDGEGPSDDTYNITND